MANRPLSVRLGTLKADLNTLAVSEPTSDTGKIAKAIGIIVAYLEEPQNDPGHQS
jgi:hypothetical protein